MNTFAENGIVSIKDVAKAEGELIVRDSSGPPRR
jgi:hypothetical protein